MKIVVIGGSGLIGRNVVRRLLAQGHDPVPASPATGVDSITGEGLADVMVGADVVVDVSNAPIWDDDAVMEFFTTSSRNLLAAERDAGIGHHVAVSIGRRANPDAPSAGADEERAIHDAMHIGGIQDQCGRSRMPGAVTEVGAASSGNRPGDGPRRG